MTTARPLRRVLFVAYYFPPLGGGGVQRSLAFTRHLPSFGYAPIVVTGPPAERVQWGPLDDSLVGELPDDLDIVRVKGPQVPRSTGWRHRAERLLRLDDDFGRWWTRAIVETGSRYMNDVDVIYASMSPFETAAAAAAVALAARRPWVADLRDPWALDDWLVYPTALHRRLEWRTMRKALASAAAIVMNTPEARAELLRRAPELADRPVVMIPNGFDPLDYAAPAPERSSDVFRIVHAGHLHSGRDAGWTQLGRRVLGGAARGLDTQARSHLRLVEAIERVLARRADLRGKVRLELVGPLSQQDTAALPVYAASHGYLPHRETIAMLRGANLLFLPMHDLADGLRARIIPGKTYEYLAAQTPILAAVPGGDTRELLEAAGNADVCAPSDVDGMSRALEQRANEWLAGAAPPSPALDLLRRFERPRLTRELAETFDRVLGGPARTPIRFAKQEVLA